MIDLVRTPHKLPEFVLTASGKRGAFDSHFVDCPFVFRHDDGSFRMTFVGWDSRGYQTGMARSDDLIHWEKLGLIIGRGPAGSITEHNVALTGILRDNALFGPSTLKRVDGRFVGTYHAYPDPGFESGPGVIGLCFSEDLMHWEVGAPVLKPDPGSPWEAGGLYKSWIMEWEGTYYLFYNAKNQTHQPWVEQTGFAISRDLVNWERFPGNPVIRLGQEGAFDDRFASDPCVLRHLDQWILFYFGLSSDRHARDGVAFSRDLRHWEKSPEILIDVGPEGSIDSRYAHKPAVITDGERLFHFYCAVAPAADPRQGEIEHDEYRGIAVATS
jgi:predicted GH43/DUF377 family glycosyl hydrolase